MRKLIGILAMLSLASSVAMAQEKDQKGRQQNQGRDQQNQAGRDQQNKPGGREARGGHIPQQGPRPTQTQGQANRNQNRGATRATPHERPRVDPRNDEWMGHDTRRDEPGLRVSRPWAHGHFSGETGPRHVYRLRGGDYRRFAMDGFYFSVVAADYADCADWQWDDDDIALYDDVDHLGLYLAYNVRLGTYVHVEFLGS